jgi:hypothetical protein
MRPSPRPSSAASLLAFLLASAGAAVAADLPEVDLRQMKRYVATEIERTRLQPKKNETARALLHRLEKGGLTERDAEILRRMTGHVLDEQAREAVAAPSPAPTADRSVSALEVKALGLGEDDDAAAPPAGTAAEVRTGGAAGRLDPPAPLENLAEGSLEPAPTPNMPAASAEEPVEEAGHAAEEADAAKETPRRISSLPPREAQPDEPSSPRPERVDPREFDPDAPDVPPIGAARRDRPGALTEPEAGEIRPRRPAPPARAETRTEKAIRRARATDRFGRVKGGLRHRFPTF